MTQPGGAEGDVRAYPLGILARRCWGSNLEPQAHLVCCVSAVLVKSSPPIYLSCPGRKPAPDLTELLPGQYLAPSLTEVFPHDSA